MYFDAMECIVFKCLNINEKELKNSAPRFALSIV